MNALRPDDTAGWYADKVRRFGYDHRGLGFGNRSSQEKRFDALMELGDLDGARILDVGCGFGDFLVYLHQQGVKPVYTGLDICEPMIERCLERFEPSVGRFVVGDVLEHQPDEHYDYVVASGLFGLDSQGARQRFPAAPQSFAFQDPLHGRLDQFPAAVRRSLSLIRAR